MTSKSRKLLGFMIIVLLLIPIMNTVRYFTSSPILVGYSENKDWKVEYVSTGRYWEAQLFPLKQQVGQPENLVFIEGKKRNEYPGKGSKNEDDSRMYYYCHTLGDSPKKNISYKFEFISIDGQKQKIHLKEEKDEFSLWNVF